MKHAAVRVEAHERKRLEQMCRTSTRPGLSGERVQPNAAGQVWLNLKAPGRDGTKHLVPTPLALIEHTAAAHALPPVLRGAGTEHTAQSCGDGHGADMPAKAPVGRCALLSDCRQVIPF